MLKTQLGIAAVGSADGLRGVVPVTDLRGHDLEGPFAVFTLDQQRYGLPLSCVERTLQVVELTPLPNAPAIVLGVINVAGTLVPIIDLRHRFRLPARDIALSDQIVIATADRRTVGLVVDSVVGLLSVEMDQVVRVAEILPAVDHIDGVATLDDGLLLIHDLAKCLSLDEVHTLDAAMNGAGHAERHS